MDWQRWLHDILGWVIVSGIPVALLGRPVWKTHRQTKTSNGTTLAHLVEQHDVLIKTISEDQETIKDDVAGLARYIGERERARDARTVNSVARRTR